jgi:hypothetical protein
MGIPRNDAKSLILLRVADCQKSGQSFPRQGAVSVSGYFKAVAHKVIHKLSGKISKAL